jgi:hypothetical protein
MISTRVKRDKGPKPLGKFTSILEPIGLLHLTMDVNDVHSKMDVNDVHKKWDVNDMLNGFFCHASFNCINQSCKIWSCQHGFIKFFFWMKSKFVIKKLSPRPVLFSHDEI